MRLRSLPQPSPLWSLVDVPSHVLLRGGASLSGGTYMKRIYTFFLTTLVLVAPSVAFAHASPVEMRPNSGARLDTAPTEISIRFSERLEGGSSRMRVARTSGERVDLGEARVSADGYTLSIPVSNTEGIYTVSWSVVSKDDGHFTRGSYAYSVNSDVALPSTNEEVVQIATTQEAALMFAEFLGNSILWGLLALFLLSRDSKLRRIFAILSLVAAIFGATGALGQLIVKTHQLAGLHGVGFWEASQLYIRTVAGSSTVIRGIALFVAGMFGVWFGFRSVRTTALVIGAPLIVFAFFRAIVSHATANPFYPELSIAINFIHVIEKDLWLGVLLVMCVLIGARVRESVVLTLLPRAFALLSANLAVLAVTAAYIIWLHLKDFSNITSTKWGAAFVPLLACAFFLVVLHVYHVWSTRSAPQRAKKYLAFSLGGEMVAAALVVFFTSVVIITSPPSHTALRSFTHTDKGVTIELSRAPYEDGMVQVVVSVDEKVPVVFIGAREGGLQPALEKRFAGGYVFPSALIPQSKTAVSVVVPRTAGYDAQAQFELSAEAFAVPSGHGRSLDLFTVFMIAIALVGVVLSAWLVYMGRTSQPQIDLRAAGGFALFGALSVGLIMLVCVGVLARVLTNSYALRCVADGNMWHMMQPTKAGVPVAGETREGCMWGMGQYEYMFVDPREYDYLSSLGEAAVSMQSIPAKIHENVPASLTFALKNADGSPATLLVDMEKYLHVVIVSEDQTAFAHIHPDDMAPLSQAAIDTSTFTVQYTFPKAGTYLVSADYAHGTTLESKQFVVIVEGSTLQSGSPKMYPSSGTFEGYEVMMDYSGARAGAVTTLQFTVSKNGVPVTDMQPYLSAVSHISVVKNDLSAFIHTHGEVHTQGVVVPPVAVRNGKIMHSMSSMNAPAQFGPKFDAHVLFPRAGIYTVWAQINVGGAVIPARFTVDVE